MNNECSGINCMRSAAKEGPRCVVVVGRAGAGRIVARHPQGWQNGVWYPVQMCHHAMCGLPQAGNGGNANVGDPESIVVVGLLVRPR